MKGKQVFFFEEPALTKGNREIEAKERTAVELFF